MSLLAGKVWTDWGRSRKELEKYWGRLCSVEGNTLDMFTSPSPQRESSRMKLLRGRLGTD